MTINERIRHLRKDILHLNQTELARKLGMKQTSVSTFEKPGGTVTEPTIKALCLAFNLNEEWIRYGSEPIFISSNDFNLEEFAKNKGATSEDMEIIKAYLELDPEIRKSAIEYYKNVCLRLLRSQSNLAFGIPDTPEELERLCPPIDVDNDTEEVG